MNSLPSRFYPSELISQGVQFGHPIRTNPLIDELGWIALTNKLYQVEDREIPH